MSKSHFEFPEIDEIGIETLDAISFAPRFNRYMYETIRPYCKGRILEIGSGIGNISRLFIEDGAEIYLSDIRNNYIETLKSSFQEQAAGISMIDIADHKFDSSYKALTGSFDTVFALNVVEHIKDDALAIKNAAKFLKPGGQMVILVPAFNFMYNSFDKALEHYRRYTRNSLNTLMANEMDVIHSQYFNLFGMLGWFVSGKILKKKTIPRNQMELYDRLIWISRTLDSIVMNKVGLSIISVATKKSS